MSALGRSKIRNLLKNKLLQTAAGFIPGAGPIVSKAMAVATDALNAADAAKQKIEDVVQVGKNAYQNLAEAIPDAQSEFEVTVAAKTALKNAVMNQVQRRDHRKQSSRLPGNSGGRMNRNHSRRTFPLPPNARVAVYPTKVSINKRQQVIPIKANSIVVVKQNRLIVWEPK